jgi:hypothetical protein
LRGRAAKRHPLSSSLSRQPCSGSSVAGARREGGTEPSAQTPRTVRSRVRVAPIRVAPIRVARVRVVAAWAARAERTLPSLATLTRSPPAPSSAARTTSPLQNAAREPGCVLTASLTARIVHGQSATEYIRPAAPRTAGRRSGPHARTPAWFAPRDTPSDPADSQSNEPFVEGAPTPRGSISAACLSAFARPLKQISMMWWLMWPSINRT